MCKCQLDDWAEPWNSWNSLNSPCGTALLHSWNPLPGTFLPERFTWNYSWSSNIPPVTLLLARARVPSIAYTAAPKVILKVAPKVPPPEVLPEVVATKTEVVATKYPPRVGQQGRHEGPNVAPKASPEGAL